MATILVPLAEGFEEIEAVGIIDVVRRAGIEVIIASVDGTDEVCGANNIFLKVDKALKGITADEIDMIVLPGGWGGTNLLAEDVNVQSLLKEMDTKNKYISAICAAPFALDKAGVLKESFTCYPSVEEQINNDGYQSDKKVIMDKNILTSQGPATAICFALEIVKILAGEEIKAEVKSGLLADFCQ